jgi:NADH dehydrogenase/NADH:ubiquinone oxidoreductase subunit G
MKYSSLIAILVLLDSSYATQLNGDDDKKSDMIPVQHKAKLPGVMPWDPKHNENDGMVQDFYDVHKTMKWIEALEKKLDGTEPTDNYVSGDWEMLKKLKQDMGMKVEFKTITDLREEKRVEKSKWDQKGPVETANTTPGEVSVEDLGKLPKKKKDKILKEREAIKGEEPAPKEEEEKEEIQLIFVPDQNMYIALTTPVNSYKEKADSLSVVKDTVTKQLTTMDAW